MSGRAHKKPAPRPELRTGDPVDAAVVRDLALANAGFGIWHVPLDTGIFACDEISRGLLGQDGDMSADPIELLPLIHPDDRANVALRLELCAATGSATSCNFRLARAEEPRWLELTARRAQLGGDRLVSLGTLRDISWKKQIVDTLEDSETRLSMVFGQTMVGVLHRDRHDNVLMVNDRFLELLGRTRDELNGLPFESFTHPDDLPWNIPLRRRREKTAEPFTVEKRYLRPDGSEVWCEVNVAFVKAANGRTNSTIVFAHDITDRKTAQLERERASDMLALTIDGAGAGTWELDLSVKTVRLSPHALAIYGLPADHPGTLAYEEWAALLDPGSLSGFIEDFGRFVESDEPQTAEFKIRRPDGEERWLRIHGRATRGPGRPNVVGLVYDDSPRKLAEEELRESEARLRLTQDAARIGTFVTEAGGLTRGSPQFFRNLGLPEDTASLDGESRERLLHPEDRKRVFAEIGRAIRAGADFHETEYRIIRADTGEVRWVLARIKPERDPEGRTLRITGAHLDITEAKQAATRLREYVNLNEAIVDSSPDCIKVLDLDGTLRFISERGLKTMEADSAEGILGTKWQDLWPREAVPQLEEALALARDGQTGRFDAGCISLKGNPMWVDVVVTPLRDDRGEVTQLLSITRDVTELRAQGERLRWAAEHDSLTGLPNRNFFDEQLQAALRGAGESGERIGLLALDVDDFKQINDAFGHDAGDALLKAVAERAGSLLEPDDFAARLGGDEFAIVIRHLDTGRDLMEIGRQVHDRMKLPIPYEDYLLDCRVSVGAAISPAHGAMPDELVRSADTALYAAKSAGRSNVLMFQPAQRLELDRRAAMIKRARAALERDGVEPFYQPKIALKTGKIEGFEALLRWRDTNGCVRFPAEIEAAFGDSELAHELSERMQDRIIGDLRGWLGEGLDPGSIAINAAAAEFGRRDFAARLLAKLDDAGVPPACLQVEVTETVFMGRGAEHVSDALDALKARGITIALDDFGTGYASLSHLKNFPVDVIKIDRSFVADLGDNAGDTAIVCALLRLGAELGMAIVAEGIETRKQAAFLRDNGCDFGQGFYFGKAISAADVRELLTRP